MSRAKGRSNHLLELAASDSEDSQFVTRPISFKTKAAMATSTKPLGRTAKAKVAKPATKTSTRRLSDRIAAAVQQTDGRVALAEKTANGRAARQADNGDDHLDGDDIVKSKDAAKQKPARGRPKRVAEVVGEQSSGPTRKGPFKRSVAARANPSVEEREIPETQQLGAMEVDDSTEDGRIVSPGPDEVPFESAIPDRHPAMPAPTAPRRPSPISPEKGDPALRRRLGDVTRKYESLEMRYRDLREVAIRDAEQNFDRLKKTTDQRANVANQLVATLKSELAEQQSIGEAAESIAKQLQESETQVQDLQVTVRDLERALSEARTEAKTLKAKLSASRSGDMAGAKTSGTVGGDAPVASSQVAQMKEDLYGDLTGLIIRGIKKEGNDDIFDCIQTGRNGTLHFKLSISNDATTSDFDNVQFMYMPQLDSNRDEALMEILPDYLVEEITFPRPHAGKFYARVMRALTERLE